MVAIPDAKSIHVQQKTNKKKRNRAFKAVLNLKVIMSLQQEENYSLINVEHSKYFGLFNIL